MNKDKIKKYLKPAVIIFILIYVATFLTHLLKPMPEGLDVSAGPFQVPSERVEFLADHTFVNEHGERESEHEIFDRKLELIEESESLVVADMFLFNSFQSAEPQTHRELSRELAAALEEKAAQPETKVVLITDPLNDLYGGLEKEMFQDLQRAGVEVVITDRNRCRTATRYILLSGGWSFSGGETVRAGFGPICWIMTESVFRFDLI